MSNGPRLTRATTTRGSANALSRASTPSEPEAMKISRQLPGVEQMARDDSGERSAQECGSGCQRDEDRDTSRRHDFASDTDQEGNSAPLVP